MTIFKIVQINIRNMKQLRVQTKQLTNTTIIIIKSFNPASVVNL